MYKPIFIFLSKWAGRILDEVVPDLKKTKDDSLGELIKKDGESYASSADKANVFSRILNEALINLNYSTSTYSRFLLIFTVALFVLTIILVILTIVLVVLTIALLSRPCP